MDDKNRGMYDKFKIIPTDPDESIDNKFVLDLFHDPYAVPAANIFAHQNHADLFSLVIQDMHAYKIKRVDKTDVMPQDKHWRCMYLVIDSLRDLYGQVAMEVYAKACENDYPLLAKDIRKRITK